MLLFADMNGNGCVNMLTDMNGNGCMNMLTDINGMCVNVNRLF